jgi:hypothetical protein
MGRRRTGSTTQGVLPIVARRSAPGAAVVEATVATTAATTAGATERRSVEGSTHHVHVWREIHDGGRISCTRPHLRSHESSDLDDSEGSDEVYQRDSPRAVLAATLAAARVAKVPMLRKAALEGAPTTEPIGALATAAEKDKSAGEQGHAAVATPTACSWEAAVAWTVAMAATKSVVATPIAVEATTTTSMAGGVAMSKTWIDAGRESGLDRL